MLSPTDMAAVAKIKAEIENLRAALDGCTDTRIREVIEFRIEERRLQLASFPSPRSRKNSTNSSPFIG
jgi:hypothetical protein